MKFDNVPHKTFYWYLLHIKLKIKSWTETKYIVTTEKSPSKIFGSLLFKSIASLLVFSTVKVHVSLKLIRAFKYLYLVDCFSSTKIKEIRINLVLKQCFEKWVQRPPSYNVYTENCHAFYIKLFKLIFWRVNVKLR